MKSCWHGGASNEVPLSRMRRIIAERMTKSSRDIPQFVLGVSVDATRMVQLRYKPKQSAGEGVPRGPSYVSMIVKAAADSIREHPRVNASFSDGSLIMKEEIGVGIAVAITDGLIVPVVRNADSKSLSEVDREIHDLIERARSRTLSLAQLEGGTFTVSNLGGIGIDAFRAIINPPEAAILAVGRISDHVVALDGSIVVRPLMWLNLTVDHRVLNGDEAARFLMSLKRRLEQITD